MTLYPSLEKIVERYADESIIHDRSIDPHLELARHFESGGERDGKIVLYNMVGHDPVFHRVVMNLWGTRHRIARHLGCGPDRISDLLAMAYENPVDYELVDRAPFMDNSIECVDLARLPVPKYFPTDGGSYFTSAIVFVETSAGNLNASYHRMMVMNGQEGGENGPLVKRTVAIRVVRRHLFRVLKEAFEKGQEHVKVTVAVGLDPVVMLPAAMSVEFGQDEMRYASCLSQKVHGEPLRMAQVGDGYPPAPAGAEMVLSGRIFGTVAEVNGQSDIISIDEGPFVDITGTIDHARSQPKLVVDRLFYRNDPVFQGLYPSGSEHLMMMGLPRESTMKTAVASKVKVAGVRLTEGGCMWLHGIVSIEKTGPDDGVIAGNAALDGHRSMKQVIVVDDDIDIFDDRHVQWALATRVAHDRDLHFRPEKKGVKEPGSTLDPTAPDGMTKKLIIDATMPLEGRERFKRY